MIKYLRPYKASTQSYVTELCKCFHNTLLVKFQYYLHQASLFSTLVKTPNLWKLRLKLIKFDKHRSACILFTVKNIVDVGLYKGQDIF